MMDANDIETEGGKLAQGWAHDKDVTMQ